MAPVPQVSDKEILKVMKNIKIFKSNSNEIYTEANVIWQEAANLFNGQITRHNLYMKFYRNLNKISEKLMEEQGIRMPCIRTHDTSKKICKNKKKKLDSNEIMIHPEKNERGEKNKDCNNELIDDLENLHELKFSVDFYDIIQKICPRRFHLFYWNKRQISLFKQITEQGLDIFFVPMTVHNKINKFQYLNYESEVIFFYVLITQIEEQTVFLAQCLTEEIKLQVIMEFFLKFLKKTSCQPNRLTSPYCQEILSAQSLVYNHCHLNQYVEDCYEYILGNLPKCKIPKTFIFIEIMSFFKSADNTLKNIPDLSSLVSKFYLNSLILLSVMTNLKEFDKNVKDILKLMLSLYESDAVHSSYNDLQSAKKHNEQYKLLIERYKKYSMIEASMKNCHCLSESVFISDGSKIKDNDSLKKYLDSIYEGILPMKCNSNNENSIRNVWECKEFFNDFSKYLYQFPLWTSLVASKIALPSHISSTINFTAISKNFDFEQTMRVNQFVEESQKIILHHCCEGEKILISSKKRNISQNLNPIDYSYLNYEENWMGKNNPDSDTDNELLNEENVETKSSSSKITDSEESFSQDSSDSFQKKGFDMNNRFQKLAAKAVAHSPKRKFGERKKLVNRVPKHTVPCPEIKIIHDQIQTSRKNKRIEKFIKNGNFLGSRVYKEEKYSLGDTSLFDAVIEILSYAFRTLKSFQDTCSSIAKTCQGEICIYKIINHWALKGCYTTLYSTRFSFFHKFGSINSNNTIKISNPKEFLENLLQEHVSRLKKFVCKNCDIEYIENNALIDLEDSTHNLQNLKENIQQALIGPSKYICPDCSNETEWFYEYGNYILLVFKNNSKPRMFLHQFCSKIVLDESQYHLIGILGHEKQNSSFYVAYTRSLNGAWKAINIMKRGNVQRSLNRIPEVYVYSAIYLNLSTTHPV